MCLNREAKGEQLSYYLTYIDITENIVYMRYGYEPMPFNVFVFKYLMIVPRQQLRTYKINVKLLIIK